MMYNSIKKIKYKNNTDINENNNNDNNNILERLNNFMYCNNINTIDVLQIIKEKYLQLQNIKVPQLKKNNYNFFIERFIKISNYDSLDKNTRHIKIIKLSQILQQIVKIHINIKKHIPFYILYYTLKNFNFYIFEKYKFKNTNFTFKSRINEKDKIIKSFSSILINFLNLIFHNEYLINIKIFQIIKNEDYDLMLSVLNIKLYNKFKNEYTYDINKSNLINKKSTKNFFYVHYHGYKYFINVLNDSSTNICIHKFHFLIRIMLQGTNLIQIIKNIPKRNLNYIYYLIVKHFMIKSSEFILTMLHKNKYKFMKNNQK